MHIGDSGVSHDSVTHKILTLMDCKMHFMFNALQKKVPHGTLQFVPFVFVNID